VKRLRVALAQINTTVGDLDGNVRKILDYSAAPVPQAPTLSPSPSSPLRAIRPRTCFCDAISSRTNLRALDGVREKLEGMAAVVGYVDADGDIFNAAAVIDAGNIAGVYRKQFLAQLRCLRREALFPRRRPLQVFEIGGIAVGVNICEDIWYRKARPRPRHSPAPT